MLAPEGGRSRLSRPGVPPALLARHPPAAPATGAPDKQAEALVCPRNCRVHLVAAPPLLPRSDPLNLPCTPHQLCLTLSRPVVVTRSCVCHLGGSLAYGPAAVLGGA